MTINLKDFLPKESLVLSGREFGKDVRRQCEFDRIDDNKEISVTIVIPQNIISLNSSFFWGLFTESVKKLGEDEFIKKYKFECSDIIRKSIEDGIRRSLNSGTALG